MGLAYRRGHKVCGTTLQKQITHHCDPIFCDVTYILCFSLFFTACMSIILRDCFESILFTYMKLDQTLTTVKANRFMKRRILYGINRDDSDGT